MKKRLTIFIAAMVIIVAAIALTSCSQWDTPFEGLDKEGSTVSVKYHAGEGGMFLDREGITLMDVFDMSEYGTDGKGNKEISLVSPEAADVRLPGNAAAGKRMVTHQNIESVRLLGWAVCDVNGTPVMENGEYQFWDFGKPLKVAEGGSYSSASPVLNLVAIWQPYASFEIYAVDGAGEPTLLETIKQNSFIYLPIWRNGECEIDMGDFGSRRGYTFLSAYLDEALTEKLTGEIFEPQLDGDASAAPVIKIYTTWEEGEWYRIYTAKQLKDNADSRGCYRIMNDIDFTGVTWPTGFTGSEFKGVFDGGEGCTISGISYTGTTYADSVGMFKFIGSEAIFRNVTFDGVIISVRGLGKNVEANYGIFTSRINDGATFEGVTLSNSKLVLTNDFFGGLQTSYIGLVSPRGNTKAITSVGNLCTAEGSSYADSYDITVAPDGTVTVTRRDDGGEGAGDQNS